MTENSDKMERGAERVTGRRILDGGINTET